MFSLAYLPAAERLTIVIIKARNLQGLGPDKKTLPGKLINSCFDLNIDFYYLFCSRSVRKGQHTD